MECPKCHGTFKALQVPGYFAYKCDGCGAMLFKHGSHVQAKDMPEVVAQDNAESHKFFNDIRDINCPECHLKMIRMIDSGQYHIQFEACTYCNNVLFDAGEFRDYSEHSLGERIKQAFEIFRENIKHHE